MKTALTIAGSDPTGGAGMQADLKVFKSFGVYGYSVPATLTAQNTKGIDIVVAVSNDMLIRQIDFLLDDLTPDALKTGLLYSSYAVELVSDRVRKFGLKNLVVDPVTVSSSGSILIQDGALDAMKNRLFPLATVITPNIYEASLLTGINIETPVDMQDAASALKQMGPQYIVITGGHLDDYTLDLFYDGKDFTGIEDSKVQGEYHGTGCAFSAAVTAMLGLGHAPLDAVKKANEFVHKAILNSNRPGSGMSILDL